MKLKNLFKRRYPYAPVAILGRKTVERALNADITKLKKVEKAIASEQESSSRQP